MTNHVDRLHPRIQAVNTETGILTPFLFKWLVALWERTGGPDDFISTLQDNLYGFSGNISITEEKDADVTATFQSISVSQNFISREVNTSYTASPYELVSMISNGMISLPPYPHDNDKVKLFNKNGSQITLSGNGNTISGETSVMTVRKNTLLDVQYFSEIGEWVIT